MQKLSDEQIEDMSSAPSTFTPPPESLLDYWRVVLNVVVKVITVGRMRVEPRTRQPKPIKWDGVIR